MRAGLIPFESWFKREYASDKLCFLCGTELENGKFSKEHIFPQWVLNKFQLWDKSIRLLNDVRYAYRSSVVPCCNNCNNDHLSKLESEIKDSMEKGYHYFKANVPPIRVYQWCLLLFYKWLYKETFFRSDLKNPVSERIVPKFNFEQMAMNHLLLRSIDKKITFDNFFPGSIFICHLKTSSDPKLNFDYFDDVPSQCLAIRLNDIGIIVMLADSGLQKILYGYLYQDILSHQLAPIQFRNLFVKCTYTQNLFSDPFQFALEDVTENSLTLKRIPKEGFSGNVYSEWNDEEYLQLMASAFNNTPDNLRAPDGRPGSFFYDNQGNWKDRPFEDRGYKE
jgi:hypothetical protein